jgi:hypothetical protein
MAAASADDQPGVSSWLPLFPCRPDRRLGGCSRPLLFAERDPHRRDRDAWVFRPLHQGLGESRALAWLLVVSGGSSPDDATRRQARQGGPRRGPRAGLLCASSRSRSHGLHSCSSSKAGMTERTGDCRDHVGCPGEPGGRLPHPPRSRGLTGRSCTSSIRAARASARRHLPSEERSSAPTRRVHPRDSSERQA